MRNLRALAFITIWAPIVLACLAAGCRDEPAPPPAEADALPVRLLPGERVTVEDMLAAWQAGQADRAVEAYLAVDWQQPQLEETSILRVSEGELVEWPDWQDVAVTAQEQYIAPWRELGRYILDQALASDDPQRRSELLAALAASARYLQDEQRLRAFHGLGDALEQALTQD